MRRLLRCAATAMLAGAASVAVAVAPPAAGAAAVDQCSTTRGTIIAVDFGHWGGPVIRGCGVQSDGQPDPDPYVLLHDGGFTTAGDSRDGPAFICRLGNAAFQGGTQYPTPAEDHCVVTPPASAYWSYWTAAPDATSWHYATMTDPPAAGGVGLWTFGATTGSGTQGGPSAALIDQLRAHNASTAGGDTRPASAPPPATARIGSSATSGGRGPGTTTSAAGGAADASGPAAGPTAAAPPAGAGSTSPGPGAAGRPGAVRVVSSTAAARQGTGSAVPTAVTAAIVVSLGAAAGVSIWRRRRNEQD